MKRYIIICIVITLLVLPKATINAEENPKNNISAEKVQIPVLSIVKHVSKTTVVAGENITVTVEIINTSNETAYNVTLIEPKYPSWAFKVFGEPNASWRLLKPGQRAYNIYILQVQNISGEICLGYAQVIWCDKNGTKYFGRSEEITIHVLPSKVEKIQATFLISKALLFGIPLFALLAVTLVFGEILTYWKWRKYQRERRRR